MLPALVKLLMKVWDVVPRDRRELSWKKWGEEEITTGVTVGTIRGAE
ncbi:MAG: hypothetical protein ACE5HD_03605 [Acidobacteriota bacterium]